MMIKDIQALAAEHGLLLTENMRFNEMGIDFSVGFATDEKGQDWLLRIPRRDGMDEQIEREKRILTLVKRFLSVEVPDWQIVTPQLIAYPLLKDEPVLTFDAQTYDISWNMDKDSANYVPSLAKVLVELHAIPVEAVAKSNLEIKSSSAVRSEIADRLQLVKSEIGLSDELDLRYRTWLDNDPLWTDYTQFIHGDLYAGHVLASKDGVVSGIIDWTTAHVGDPAVDFSGHITVFGEASLSLLITEYEKQGGTVWKGLFDQAVERAAAAPLAYGFFALETQDENHILAARAQLGVG